MKVENISFGASLDYIGTRIVKEAKTIGYKKVYLKTTLNNYYEKFGAKFYSTLDNKEKIYYIEIE